MEKIKVLEYCNKYNADIMDVISKYCNYDKQIYTVKLNFSDKEYVFIYEQYILDCNNNMFYISFDLKQIDTNILMEELNGVTNLSMSFIDGSSIELNDILDIKLRTTTNPSTEIHMNSIDISFGGFISNI